MGLDEDARSNGQKLRLSAFPRPHVRATEEAVGIVREPLRWPKIRGCFVVLFTARSGSTYLTRELEYAYDIGRMGETLNPAQVKNKPVAKIVATRKREWFGFKAGVQGVVAGELYGFFDAYLDKTVFLRLVRKDIVAQAISLKKASQTGQWHAHNAPERAPEYDDAAIMKSIKKIVTGTEHLRLYAQLTGRPCRTVFYEDFAEGDFSSVLAATDALGAPRRPPEADVEHRSVERMSDEINEAWRARFTEEMNMRTRDMIQRYLDALQG